MNQRRCTGITKSGRPCKSFAISDDGTCLVHSEAYRERLQAGQARGGAARSNVNRAAARLPSDLKDVGAMLLLAMKDVRSGALDPRPASALAALANAYKNIYSEGVVSAKLDLIEERLAAAESEKAD